MTHKRLGSSLPRSPLLGFALAVGALAVMSAVAQVPPEPVEVHHIHGVALDRRDPEILYVATHTGLVRLRPQGEPEWVGPRFDLMGFTAHPQDSGLIYASGHPDLATYREQKVGNLGLLLSRDGGQTWRSVLLRGEADFHALAYSPRNGGELYGWSVAGRPGLYRVATTDWAATLVPATGLADVLSLAASTDPARPLLAGARAGLFASRDRGATWTRVSAIPAGPVTAVAYHGTDSRLVYLYVGQPDRGLFRSRDGGGTWEPAGVDILAEGVAVALAVGPDNHVVVATSKSGILRSRDGGHTWQTVLEQGRPVSDRR